jgi:carboxypeptidase family protein/TonB-dependent receptor-like protein
MSKAHLRVLTLTVFAGMSLLASQAKAQAVYGSIFGTVTDPKGAAVAGATVTVTDESKGTAVSVTSNATGDYAVPHLIPDVYDLKVTAGGFEAFETKGISVLADTAPRIDPTLAVGAAATTIEVSADTEPELKTDRADVATVFDQQQISSLPVGDQNFTNLQLLLPGAQILGWAHAADENPQASKQIQIDGQAFGGVAYELDGADNQDPILGIVVVNPTTDAVTEVKITTQDYDAEEGKAVSAIMTAQTRSGSNQFHGDIYDFRTGNANLARDPYDQAPGSIPAGLKNRMGGSIGGPFLKDKLFFFANYEGQRQKVGSSAIDTLPTVLTTESCLGAAAQNATKDSQGGNGCDFSQYLAQFGAAGTIYDNLANPNKASPPTAYPHNIIPRTEIGAASGPSLALLKLLEPYVLARNITYTPGVGSESGLDSNYAASGTGLFNSDQWTERVDYTLSEKTHLFERLSRFTDTLTGAVMFGAAGGPGFGINNYGGNSNGANDSDVAGLDYAINPKLLTDLRLGYVRYNVIDNKHDQGTEFAKQLGIPGINTGPSILSGSPGFFIPNVPGGAGSSGGGNAQPVFGDGLQVNRCNCPLIEREDQFQIVNNWTKMLGNHTFKTGVDLRYGRNLRVPSDNDRDGLLYFGNTSSPYVGSGPTENTFNTTPGGLGWATFMLGEVTSYNRYVSTSFNAKEFQKRTFFYVADSWRITPKLTLNLGGRLDLFWPESVNGVGNGALLNMSDGYLYVAGVGGISSNMGWTVRALKQLAPRLGIAYQYDPKTVIRAGYGRSFDMGVFGSIFGHTVTQNIPVLANQAVSATNAITPVFNLNGGPSAYTFPTVPSNGLLPNPGYSISSASRQNPLTFPTLDAWNLSVQRSLTPTLSVTVSYVGNKGTHTLGDGDGNTTNQNEATNALPGQFSVTGQTMIYDNSVPAGVIGTGTNGYPANHTSTNKYLQRFYGGSLAACRDPNYISLAGLQAADGDTTYLKAGMCGWVPSVSNRWDNQNTEYDALQITLAQSYHKGLSLNTNYVWASAFDENTNWYTWYPSVAHMRDSNTRRQQLVGYGSYDLPIGKGKQFVPGANRATDLVIGGWQLSAVANWASGLPYTASYNECGANLPQGSICDPSVIQGVHLKTHLSAFTPTTGGVGVRQFFTPAPLGSSGSPFYNPGLDNFGNAGQNTYFGPRYFGTDMALTKRFTIWEKVSGSFRFDAFNIFNHIAAGNPNGNVENGGTITAGAQGYGESQDFGPRQLEFSAGVQF